MPESQRPIYDAFCDAKSQELEGLHLDERFIETLETRAKVKSTIVHFKEELTVERDLMPSAITEALYIPGRALVTGFSAQLIQEPEHEAWALDVRCAINGAPYFINSSLRETKIETEDIDGNELTLILPSDAGAQFVSTFIKASNDKNAPQEILSYPDIASDPDALAELLFELGQRFGYSVKGYDADIDQFDATCRALSVKFMAYESARESSTGLSLSGAIDFGAEPTRFSFSQTTSSDPKTTPKESISVGPSRIPIENFLVMRDFGIDLFSTHEADRPGPEQTALKTRLAPLIVTTLKVLTESNEEQL